MHTGQQATNYNIYSDLKWDLCPILVFFLQNTKKDTNPHSHYNLYVISDFYEAILIKQNFLFPSFGLLFVAG